MRLFFKFIFVLFLSLGFAYAEENKTKGVDEFIELLGEIDTINSQMQILKLDLNSSNDTNFVNLKERKRKLFAKVPMLIVKTHIDKNDRALFFEKKENLKKIVARYSKNKNSHDYIKNAIEFEKLKINEIFFKTILQLEKLFKKGAKSAEIQNLLENSILDLNIETNQDIKLSDKVELATNLKELEIRKNTVEEILIYLKDNAQILSSSFALNELNLNSAVEWVNEKMPSKSEWLNIGKIVVIILIFVVFISFTKILSWLTYFLTVSFFAKNARVTDIKDQILSIIKRPISALLVAYALKICIALAYYPLPIPLGLINALGILFTILFAWLVISILNGYGLIIIGEITKKTGRKEIVNLILKILYFIIVVIAVLTVLSRLGFDISAIIASLGIGGLAVAFAAKDIIANFFSSVMLIFDNSFSQGDYINCGSVEGTVVEIGLRKTTIRSGDNAWIFVPNSTLVNNDIINWTRRKAGRIIDVRLGLTYDSTIENLKQCINDIKNMLLTHDDISRADNGGAFVAHGYSRLRENIVSLDDLMGYKSNIFVSLDALSDSSIDIAVVCFTKAVDRATYIEIKQDIIFKIMEIVNKNGLEFAFPSQSLYIEKKGDSDEQIR